MTSTAAEQQTEYQRQLELNQAAITSRLGAISPIQRVTGVKTALKDTAKRLQEASLTGIAIISCIAQNIPGEYRVDVLEEPDERTFTFYRGEVRLGTMALCVTSGSNPGGGLYFAINKDALMMGAPTTKKSDGVPEYVASDN